MKICFIILLYYKVNLKFLFQPYTMRICILTVLKELIINILNRELDDFRDKAREDYISILQDHLLDINAFVRSKVII